MKLTRLAVNLLISLGIAAASGSGLVAVKAARHEASAQASYPPTGQILTLDGIRIHAQVMGRGPDVVLIHGSAGNLRDMTFRLAPRLAERYRVIAFDRPGLGYTDPITDSGATIVQQVDLMRRAARELGAETPIVLGQSYGGSVALAWAVHFPDALSGLVPVAAASHPWTAPLSPFYRVTSSSVGRALVVPLLTAFVTESRVARELESVFAPQSTPQGYMSHFGPGLTLRRTALRANAAQRANLLDEITALHRRYGEISVPTEILHGTADTTVGLSVHGEPLSRDIPDAVLTRLDGIGHMPQHVAVPQIMDAVDRVAARAGLR